MTAPRVEGIDVLLKGRMHDQECASFCHIFLPCVVGKKRWSKGIKRGALIESLVTPSDEAFAFLCLENSWDCWLWEMDKSKDEIKKLTREDPDNVPTPMHSLGKGASAKKNQGWSGGGIVRFKEIAMMVKKDREDHKDFDEKYHEYVASLRKDEEEEPQAEQENKEDSEEEDVCMEL